MSIALPALESLRPAASASAAAAASDTSPRRLVCIGNEFGMYSGEFWPEKGGTNYESKALLKPLVPHRDQFTLFSHLDHGHKGGHFAVHTFLTGVKSEEAKAMPDGGISVDQRAAEHVGSQTRFPSLTIGSEDGLHGGCMMSWTRTGTRIPPIAGPRQLFEMLFVEEDSQSKQRIADRLAMQGSILDAVLGDAHTLGRRLNKDDGRKLAEYLSSVRDVELKLSLDRRWQNIAKPKTTLPVPVDQGLAKDLPAIYELIALALQTDSTRIATLEIGGSFAVSDLGIKQGYHALSHHGQLPENIELLVQIELYQMQQFARFLERLQAIPEPTGGTLLDRTMVLHGSGMGNANSHINTDLPIILAGGGFRHGSHKVYPAEANRRVPLANLYVSMLQRFGVEADRFSGSTGTLTGLEMV